MSAFGSGTLDDCVRAVGWLGTLMAFLGYVIVELAALIAIPHFIAWLMR